MYMIFTLQRASTWLLCSPCSYLAPPGPLTLATPVERVQFPWQHSILAIFFICREVGLGLAWSRLLCPRYTPLRISGLMSDGMASLCRRPGRCCMSCRSVGRAFSPLVMDRAYQRTTVDRGVAVLFNSLGRAVMAGGQGIAVLLRPWDKIVQM